MPGDVAVDRSGRPTAMPGWLRGAIVVGLLYLFLVGVGLLEAGIGALSPDVQEELFASVSNPVSGLLVGTLATVLAQSSSVTTSTIVGLVGAGLVGVEDAVPMVMGANIGTTVTNTLASMGHLRRPQEFRSAFAAATVHDFFNVLSVMVLLPVELVTGLLSNTAEWMSGHLVGQGGAEYESPIKTIVKEPVGWVESLWDAAGVHGSVLGVSLVLCGLACIFVALTFITRNMRLLVADRVERSINTILGRGAGFAAMVVGLVVTVSVQSSSITTSILIPLAGSGVLTLANTYPVTLGANVGTTVTALLASLATSRPEALTVALVHTLFNLLGILLFYPVPPLRRIPLVLAERLAEVASRRRTTVAVYVMATFILVPAIGIIALR